MKLMIALAFALIASTSGAETKSSCPVGFECYTSTAGEVAANYEADRVALLEEAKALQAKLLKERAAHADALDQYIEDSEVLGLYN